MTTAGMRDYRAGQEKPGRRALFGFDPVLLAIIVIMMIFGMIMVFSATWDVSWRLTGDPNALFRNQAKNLVIGLFPMVVAAFFPLRWLRKLAVPIMGVTILVLMTVLILTVGEDTRRALFEGSIQPSEMAKLAIVIYLAVWMESKGDRLRSLDYGLLPLIGIIGIVAGLVLLQIDLSAFITICAVALGMFFMGGGRFWQFSALSAGGAAFAFAIVRLTGKGWERWSEYVNGLTDVENAHYHVLQSLQALYSGGIFGVGLGASRAKFGILPAPHTDSIFSIIGEELGLLGALVVILLFILLLRRGFRVAGGCEERLGMLLASGIVFWIMVEAMINMAVLVGLIPFAGNALPFFSYGGSSLVTTMAGCGLLLNVSRMSTATEEARGTLASFGVSWRNGRRNISRLGNRRRARI
ncbi:MAG: cell division protein FtsW [Anaerolineales bacterium]|nr:cell division protein FtsW [Anaerolineales bacterium]